MAGTHREILTAPFVGAPSVACTKTARGDAGCVFGCARDRSSQCGTFNEALRSHVRTSSLEYEGIGLITPAEHSRRLSFYMENMESRNNERLTPTLQNSQPKRFASCERRFLEGI